MPSPKRDNPDSEREGMGRSTREDPVGRASDDDYEEFEDAEDDTDDDADEEDEN